MHDTTAYRVPLRGLLIIAILLVTSLSLGVLAWLSHSAARRVVVRQITHHLVSVVAMQKARVTHHRDQDRERLALVASRTQLRLSLAQYLKTPQRQEQERILRIIEDARRSVDGFRDIAVFSPEGALVASTASGPNQAGMMARAPLWQRGCTQTQVGIFFLEQGEERQYLAAPLHLDENLIGCVVIESDVSDYLEVTQDYTGLGETGETLLVGPGSGGDSVYLTPLRFDAQAILRQVAISDQAGGPVASPLSPALRNGVRLCRDYRAEPVLAGSAEIGSSGWLVVVKIDEAEALSPLSAIRNTQFAIVGVSLLLALLAVVVLAGAIVRPLTRLTGLVQVIAGGDLAAKAEPSRVREIDILATGFNTMTERLLGAQERLRENIERLQREIETRQAAEKTLQLENSKLESLTACVGAGLVVVSDQYTVTWANQVICELFGEVVGRPCYQAFNKREQICPDCGAQRVLEQGVALAVHEQEGQDRGGRRIWSRIIATPLRDDSGKVVSVLEVLMPITEHKQLLEEKEGLIVELREAMARVKTLSGLLPICSSCKKIRDDTGYWSQIEAYIAQHSEAQFSHGICPDCVKKLYPGLSDPE
ncbi:MAG: hypothetical protein BWK76_00440 [Desulfobulbaceae bacterium A2]|nr:MAG: hypothetical protein BWK76_00440 [Desulfobulbaceae bacterium A2]